MKKLVFAIAIFFSLSTFSAHTAINVDEIEEAWQLGQKADEMQDFNTAILMVEVNKLTWSEKKAAMAYAGVSILIVPLFLLVTGLGYNEKKDELIDLGEMAMDTKPFFIFQNK